VEASDVVLERAEVRRRPAPSAQRHDRRLEALRAARRAVAGIEVAVQELAAELPTSTTVPPSPPAELAAGPGLAAAAAPAVPRPPARPDRSAPAEPGPPPQVSEGSSAVFRDDFPDPHVIQANGSWWAFSTQIGLTAVPVLRSDDLVRWEWVGDALQDHPSWAEWTPTWAPAVLPRESGFVLYYTTRHRETGLQCISRATSVLPQGPYVDRSTEPLVCQTDRGGSIDPSPFVDADGRTYLLWKSEGTVHGEPTRLWIQETSEDGLLLLGRRVELLARELPWELPIIESPSMVREGGRYHLLYSGNRWESADYAIGHAVCDSVLGPCRRTSAAPILRTRRGAAGPGGQEVLRLPDGGLALVHHAWDPAAVGYPHGARMLHLARLHLDRDRAAVGGPLDGQDASGLLGIGR